mmetsp:Transcript_30074/g.84732  ORF Transcript_30074/g.84732 Transcript_30074/m.84732 type:complete len:430 (-) Transcript_30074:1236-2525(-)
MQQRPCVGECACRVPLASAERPRAEGRDRASRDERDRAAGGCRRPEGGRHAADAVDLPFRRGALVLQHTEGGFRGHAAAVGAAGAPGLRGHGLRVRPDRHGEDLHDGGVHRLRRQAGPHPARGRSCPGCLEKQVLRQAPGDHVLPGNLQRGAQRPAGASAVPGQAGDHGQGREPRRLLRGAVGGPGLVAGRHPGPRPHGAGAKARRGDPRQLAQQPLPLHLHAEGALLQGRRRRRRARKRRQAAPRGPRRERVRQEGGRRARRGTCTPAWRPQLLTPPWSAPLRGLRGRPGAGARAAEHQPEPADPGPGHCGPSGEDGSHPVPGLEVDAPPEGRVGGQLQDRAHRDHIPGPQRGGGDDLHADVRRAGRRDPQPPRGVVGAPGGAGLRQRRAAGGGRLRGAWELLGRVGGDGDEDELPRPGGRGGAGRAG